MRAITITLFLVASLAMVVNALVTDPVHTGITFGIIVAGVPAYYLWILHRRARR